MKHISLIVLAVGVSGAVPSIGQAQGAGTEWDVLNREVLALYRAGKHGRAVVVTQKALQVAEWNGGPDQGGVATSLDNPASLHRTRGDEAEAEPRGGRAPAIRGKALGLGHPNVATSLDNHAAFYRDTKGDKDAEALKGRAAETARSNGDPADKALPGEAIRLCFVAGGEPARSPM